MGPALCETNTCLFRCASALLHRPTPDGSFALKIACDWPADLSDPRHSRRAGWFSGPGRALNTPAAHSPPPWPAYTVQTGLTGPGAGCQPGFYALDWAPRALEIACWVRATGKVPGALFGDFWRLVGVYFPSCSASLLPFPPNSRAPTASSGNTKRTPVGQPPPSLFHVCSSCLAVLRGARASKQAAAPSLSCRFRTILFPSCTTALPFCSHCTPQLHTPSPLFVVSITAPFIVKFV